MKNFTLTCLLFIFSFSTFAQKLPFQGYLEESGVPVNGTRTFDFELADYGWTETKTDVTIENGIYNVVLGDSTSLPDSIFSDRTETPLTIIVDGTNIGEVTLYKPLGFNNKNFILKNESGLKRAELSVNNLDGGDLAIYGVNDSVNIRLSSINGGYYGSIGIYDSLGISNGFLRSNATGGSLQLNKLDESGNFASAIVARSSPVTSSLLLYAQNPTADNVSKMIENYTATREIFNGPALSNNYKRSGTDWYDNEGRILAAVGNAREESGDPEGGSGYVSLWGKNSFNAELTGKRWENNDLPILNLFGSNDDGGDWWMRNFYAEVLQGSGTDSYSDLGLLNTDNGGVSTETVFITSNHNSTGAGLIDVKDSLGAATVSISGREGNISLNRTSDGGSSVNIFQVGGTGGLSIQDANDIGRFLFIGGEGNLVLRDDTESETVRIESQTGNIVVSGTVTAQGTVLTSDKRFKKNIATLENSLENTLKLRGTSYYWKDENKTQKRQIGVIAQEVEEVYPEFVHTNEEGYKSVNYSQMTAVLIEAIKELNQEIQELKKENGELKASLEETQKLSNRMDKLEKLLLENNKVANN